MNLTDDYLIELIPDDKPVVKVLKPGRDWRASNIEEVTVRVEANDDFGLDRVEVRYSINGGEWPRRRSTSTAMPSSASRSCSSRR